MRLRESGLRPTLPRARILRVLEEAPHKHLSVEEIYLALHNADKTVSLPTVYRVLTQFAEAGLVVRHRFDGGRAVYELTPAAHHDHILCVKCGSVEEFVSEAIEKRQHEVAATMGYRIVHHELVIYGLCRRCNSGEERQ